MSAPQKIWHVIEILFCGATACIGAFASYVVVYMITAEGPVDFIAMAIGGVLGTMAGIRILAQSTAAKDRAAHSNSEIPRISG